MAYKLPQPKKEKEKDTDIFNLPENKEDKTEKQTDIFKLSENDIMPKEEGEEKTELFSIKEDDDEHIKSLNEDLYSEESPIKIKDKSTLLIEADGKTHTIKKSDLVEYHRKYRLDGIDGNDIQGFRNLGSIKGDWEKIDNIYKDSHKVFGKIDSHSGGYQTLPESHDD